VRKMTRQTGPDKRASCLVRPKMTVNSNSNSNRASSLHIIYMTTTMKRILLKTSMIYHFFSQGIIPERLTISLILILSVIISSSNTRAELVDRVVAEVNEEVITLSELNAESAAYMRKILVEVPPENREAAINQLHQEVINSLIDKTLIAQEAAKQGITVSEEEVDNAIDNIIASSNMPKEVFFEKIQESGLDIATYRSNIQSQIFQNKVITRNVRSKIVITDEMILDFYDTHYTQHVGEGGYYLLQIGMSWENSESLQSDTPLYKNKLAAENRAKRVHRLAQSGQDFQELARQFSDLPSAVDGGDIGVFQEEDMASYMKDAVTTLKPGEISDIIETPVGYQFFKLLSSSEGGIVIQAPFDTVKNEISDLLFQQEMKKQIDEWLTDMRSSAYIKIML